MKIFRKLRLHELLYNKKDKRLAAAIKLMVGSKPLNLSLYKLAVRHSSAAEEIKHGVKASNERLEFLGDAVLGTVVAEHLFMKFPYRDEGFLTETRSRIVNRESLNRVGQKIGLSNIVESDLSDKGLYSHKSIYGDTLEALVGAVYLDRGYIFCRQFILSKILSPYFDLDNIITTVTNFKSKIIEWSQRENKEVEFFLQSVTGTQRFKEFTIELKVEGEVFTEGKGPTKKKAEQEAAKNAFEKLKLAL
ncbi:ribonuclease III [Echinicola vietnamensis]|uniref:Ribonuclease 3 n=1 Tax=Echinicola vietnamensis (strain DSM 17526 / LMG 23754 / KMM 6221) TaxID=926556 RepID=L0G0P8_ECHVK|nr:ribonuclease III [Echinicola vietnamensis]AGA78561.1 ribonuclease III [Echinicola vietnamensis DSM 17526]